MQFIEELIQNYVVKLIKVSKVQAIVTNFQLVELKCYTHFEKKLKIKYNRVRKHVPSAALVWTPAVKRIVCVLVKPRRRQEIF